MNEPLSTYVRALRADPSATPPEELLGALEAMIRARLKAWGLLSTSSPRSLYNMSQATWAGAEGHEALSELALDAFCYTFLERRLAFLERADHELPGLVQRNVKNFLIDLGRKHDPVGFGTQRNLRRVLESCVRRERLATIPPGLRGVEPHAVLIAAGLHPEDTPQAEERELRAALCAADAWPDLASQLPRDSDPVRQRLAAAVEALAPNGAPRFASSDLRRVTLREARAALLNLHLPDNLAVDEAGDLQPVHIEPSPRAFSDTQWAQVSPLVERAIHTCQRHQKVRARLHLLWRLIVEAARRCDQPMPSQADLARAVGASTSTLSDDMELLRTIFSRCFPDVAPSAPFQPG